MFWYCVDAKHRNHCGKAKKSRFFLCCTQGRRTFRQQLSHTPALLHPYIDLSMEAIQNESVTLSVTAGFNELLVLLLMVTINYTLSSFSRQVTVNCAVILQLLLTMALFLLFTWSLNLLF